MTESLDGQPQAGGRRERRIARRRQEILAAAAQIFARKGYASTTTQEIAEQADVAEGTLYNYFGGKREILLAIANETETPMAAALEVPEGLDIRAAMTAMVEKALYISEAQLPFMRTVFREAWVDDGILQEFAVVWVGRIYHRLTALLAAYMAAGDLRPLDPALCARMVMGMFNALILPTIRGLASPPTATERRTLAETAADLLLDGMRLRDRQTS